MHDSTTNANVVNLLGAAAARVPQRPALIVQSPRGVAQSVTFGDLWERVRRFAGGLQAAGLKPGDRAVLMIPMSIELYEAMLGVIAAGGTAIFVDPWMPMRRIAAFCAFAEPVAFVGIPKSHLLRLLAALLRRLPLSITTGKRLWRIPARYAWHEIAGPAAPLDLPLPRTAADPALITFTSGSSGTPKGANRTHGFLAAQHHALQTEFTYQDTDVDMPMFPVFALNNLAAGLTSVIPCMDFGHVAAVDPGVIATQLRNHAVTTATASPPFFDRLATFTGAQPLAERVRLRRILTGGAPVSDAQLQHWRSVWPQTEIVIVYGSTEAEPVAHVTVEERLSLSTPITRGYCAGRPVAAVRSKVVRIVRVPVTLGAAGWAEWELPTGATGELVVAGAHVGRDYFHNPDAVAENKIFEADGTVWHRMGDTGWFDSDGRFWLAGRVHSTILRTGTAWHAQLIEQAAQDLVTAAHAGRCAALGWPDAALGESVLLVVEGAKPGAAETVVAEWKATLATRDAMLIDDVVFLGAPLPTDPRHNSKIDYHRLAETLRARGLA